ncbi:MAG: penicillin acylase family protein [Saprospiraceae bacterium]|nr:penicillin acylase family protein [Saprospiraceae bacterium]
MKTIKLLQWGMLIIYTLVCSILLGQEKQKAIIKWDDWGVPHITAKNDASVYYALGWAQMEAHANLILKGYGKSRGRAAEYWGGAENWENDVLVRKIGIPDRAGQWFQCQPDDIKKNLLSFTAGMNDFCLAHPEVISEELKCVLPIEATDPLARLQQSYHLKVGAFALDPQASQWKNAGSNAWAIAPAKSTSGHALLLVQPHPVWSEDFMFFETHLKSEELDIYGITLLGNPVIAMGFNQNVGWGLTFNQADAMDLIQLDTKGDQYLIDGQWKNFEMHSEQIKMKEGDATHIKTIQVKKSDYGFIIEEKGNKALALRLSGLDRPFFLQQMDRMAKAKTSKILKMQWPCCKCHCKTSFTPINMATCFTCTMASFPNALEVPYRIGRPSSPLTQRVSSCTTTFLLPICPKSRTLPQASWPIPTTVPGPLPIPLSSHQKPIHHILPTALANFDSRSRQSLKMLLSKSQLSFDDLVTMQASTHSELSDRTLDALIQYAASSADTQLHAAANILQRWDKKMDGQSKGAVLFANWYFASRKIQVFSDTTDLMNPLQTPHLLTEPAKAKLMDAVKQTLTKYNQLDVSWAEVYKTMLHNQSYDGGLGLNELGSFNAGFYRPLSKTTYGLQGGTAFTSVVEWGPRIRAKGLLSYGNASQDQSPFKNNQIELLLSRQLATFGITKKTLTSI